MKITLPKRSRLLINVLLLQIILFGTSCRKTDMNFDEGAVLLKESAAMVKKSGHSTVTTEPYNSMVFDSCRGENVLLAGQAVYKLTESFDKGYYINYEIMLDKVIGIGEKSDTRYHGGGKIVGTVRANEDGTKVKGKVTYKVKYVGNNGNQIYLTQNARFIMVNNIIKVDFNDIFDSCN